MGKKLNDNEKENITSDFIDDLNDEKKPKGYKYIGEDEELDDLFETIRSVKRLKKDKKKNNIKYNYRKIASIVAIVLLIFTVSNFFPNLNILDNEINSNNLVHAMENAFNKINNYKGEIEIISINNGEIDFKETVKISYEKPNKYHAVHEYDNYSYREISDGDKLLTITDEKVTIDYGNAEKNLWRYHIKNQIDELSQATEIKEMDIEIINNRKAYVYKYRFDVNENYNKIWVDKETNLPLKNEINISDNRKLINHFTEIEINTKLKTKEFSYDLDADKKIEYVNKLSDIDSVKNIWRNIENFTKNMPDEYILNRVVKLNKGRYDYLVKYNTKDKEKYLDLYVSEKPLTKYYSNESELKGLNSGVVEINEGAINVFKEYIGKTNLIKWIKKDMEVVIVSNMKTLNAMKILENTVGEKTKVISKKEINKLNLKPSINKKNH